MRIAFSRTVIAAGALLALALANSASAQTAITLAHDHAETSTHHQAALRWKELVESRSDGQVTVEVFPASLLGSGTQMIEQAQAGAIQAVLLPTGWVAPFAPTVSVLDLPFLFPSREIAHQVIDGEVGQEILRPLQDVNLQGVAFLESGFKQFTGNFAIAEPGDFEGHRIRTMPSPVIQEQFKAFGAVPTSIDFAELYTALQQAVVDGQENPIATIADMRFYEVQDYMALSDHGFLAYVFMFNKEFYDSQSDEMQTMLRDAALEAAQYQRTIIREAEEKHLETFREAGLEIHELTAEQRTAFEEASQPVYEWYKGEYSPETLELIQGAVSELTQD